MTNATRAWAVAHVEDDPDMLRQVKEYLEGETFDFGAVRVVGSGSFEEALGLLRERRIDIVILDVFRGKTEKGDRAGIAVLKEWQSAGFSPVVIYTALPEGLGDVSSVFVRVVGKETGSLKRLADEIRSLFALKIPQIRRAVVQHLDDALRAYMWGFVVAEWDRIKGLVEQPDFVRLLLRRLAVGFARGVEPVLQELYPGSSASPPADETVHPVEYYVKPPIGEDPQLGDLRQLRRGDRDSLYLILWPSCDLVHGHCKVDRALCAQARPIEEFDEFKQWSEQGDAQQYRQGQTDRPDGQQSQGRPSGALPLSSARLGHPGPRR